MAIFKPGDVLYASFPYTDAPLYKRRPVLAISGTDYQKKTGHVVALMITTARDSQWPNDYFIRDLKTTGLAHESFVRFKFFSLTLDLIEKQLGRLSLADWKKIRAELRKITAP